MGIVATQTGRFYDSYRREFGLHPTPAGRAVAWAGLALAFVAVPALASDYWLGNFAASGVAANETAMNNGNAHVHRRVAVGGLS